MIGEVTLGLLLFNRVDQYALVQSVHAGYTHHACSDGCRRGRVLETVLKLSLKLVQLVLKLDIGNTSIVLKDKTLTLEVPEP